MSSNDRLERRVKALEEELEELKLLVRALQMHYFGQGYVQRGVEEAVGNYYDTKAAKMRALLERHEIQNASIQQTLDSSQATLNRTASLRPPSTSGGEHARHVKGLHGKRC